MGIVAQINGFINLTATGTSLGIPTGLTTKISGLFKDNSETSNSTIGFYFIYFIRLFSIISILISVGLIIFSNDITTILVDDSKYVSLYILGILSLIFIVLYRITESFLRSIEEIDVIVKISILSSLFSLIVLVPLIVFFKINGVAWYLLSLGVFPFLIFLFKYRYVLTKYISEKLIKPKRRDSIDIFKLGIQSSYANFLHLGVLILIRKIVISNFGLESNGIYQSVLGISITGFQIIYMFLSTYTLPKLSGLKSDKEINFELNKNFRFLLFILIPMIICIYTFKDFIIIILFSGSFLQATNLMFFQLLGDLFRATAALFGLWLLPKMKLKELIIINFIYNACFLFMPYIFFGLFGKNLIIIPVSYMLAFLIQFILYFSYTYFNIRFRFSKEVFNNIFYSMILLLVTFFISMNFTIIAYFVNIMLIIIWLSLYLNESEKLKVKTYLYDLLKFKK